MPRHDIRVDLTGVSHGFDVIDRIRKEMRAKGVSAAEITRFTEECLFGREYEHLLGVVRDWVEVSHA